MLDSQDVTGFGLKLFVNTNNRRCTVTANLQNKLSAESSKNLVACLHVQLARRDHTAKLFMKILYWIIKENVALEKWNSLKGEKCF